MNRNSTITKAFVQSQIQKVFKRLETQQDKKREKDMHVIQQSFQEMQTQMDERFSSMQKRMDERFTVMQTQMDERFSTIEEKIDRIQNTMDNFLELHLKTSQEQTMHAEGMTAHKNIKKRVAHLESLHDIKEKTA